MYISLDCKMSVNTTKGRPITICLYTETGKFFYAEFIDFYPNEIKSNEYLYNHVIPSLKYIKLQDVEDYWNSVTYNLSQSQIVDDIDGNIYMFGTTYDIINNLNKWLSSFDRVDILSDLGYLNYSYLISILKEFTSNTANISNGYIDLNTIIACTYGISHNEATYVDRNKLLVKLDGLSSGNDTSIANCVLSMEIFKKII